MTLIKDRCDSWIKYAQEEWFENWLGPKSSLRDSTRNMVKRMKDASLTSSDEAWNLQERLKRLSDGFDKMDDVTNEPRYRYEKPEVYMECAFVAYQLGDLQEALNLLRVSNGDFPRRFSHKAVSYWIYGCIQWQLPAHSEDAVLSWERSMQILKEVENDTSRNDSATSTRCREVANIMKDAIDEASRTNVPPPPPASGARARPAPSASSSVADDTATSAPSDSSRGNVGSPSSTPNARRGASFSKSKFSAYETKLKIIPFYGSIPAGDPARVFDYPIGSAGIDGLELETDCFYKAYSIRQEKEIRLNPSSEYFILKADGDSMNISEPINIDNGDCVLLFKTNTAQDNDVVAAMVLREDSDATLKRYRVEADGSYLVSESDSEKIRIKMSGTDHVVGVVLAVLKPADER